MKISDYHFHGLIIAALCFILPVDGFAQSSRGSYFMKTSYARTSLNPALRPDQSYIGVPFLSNIYADVNTNSLNLNNLTFKLNGERATFMHAQIPTERALANIEDENFATTNVGFSIFSAGIFKGDSYWNLNFAVRTDADVNIPKSLFELLKVGFDENETVTHDLSKISLTQNAFAELGVTNSRTFLNKSLTLGARAKVLFGLSYADLDARSLNITAGREFWTAKSKVTLKGAGPGIKAKYTQSDYDPNRYNFDGFKFGSFNIPGFGMGVDIGAVYDFKNSPVDFLKKLRVSYALNDIGFIWWTRSNVIQLSSEDTEVTISPSDYTIHSDGRTSITDIFENALDDIRQAVNLHEEASESGYSTVLRANMNVGLEYEFWKNKMTAGFLYSSRFGKYFTTNEFTLSANYTPKQWLATSLSYSFAHSQFKTFGLAVHLAPSKGINFFLASDYTIVHISPQWLPSTSRAANFQMGVSIPFGGKR